MATASARIRGTRTGLRLLVATMVAACSVMRPTDFGDLRVAVDNASPTAVIVTLSSSGPGMTGGGDAPAGPGGSLESILPLAPTWSVKVDGKRIIGSGDPTDLGLPSPGQRRDLLIQIQVAADGTVTLLDAHYAAPGRSLPNG